MPKTPIMREDLRDRALQLAFQLPRDHDDALAVLGYMLELVTWGEGQPPPPNGAVKPQKYSLVRFPDGTGNSPRDLAKSTGKP
jgi:hypothetical protein